MTAPCGSRFRVPHAPAASLECNRYRIGRVAAESWHRQSSRTWRDSGRSGQQFVPRESSGDRVCSLFRLRLGRFLIVRGRRRRLVLTREPLGHFFLLPLFTLLFFLTLFKGL